MRIRELRMVKFMSHDDTVVAFPATGIVVVTGPNGAGKSSLVEGVSSAFWGKTLRGTPPWPEATGLVRATADGIQATRTKGLKSTKLAWETRADGSQFGNALDSLNRLGALDDAAEEESQPSFESTTHAQQALEKLIGSFDVWRRSSAFSSSDAAHFSLATDKQRKALLETILGLDIFDSALERCRADLKACEAGYHAAAAEEYVANDKLRDASTRVEAMGAALARAQEELPALLPMPDAAEAGRITALIDKGVRVTHEARARLRALDTRAAVAGSALQTAKAAVAEATRTKVCPACRRPLLLPGGTSQAACAGYDLDALGAERDAAARELAQAQVEVGEEVEEVEEGIAVLRLQLSDLNAAKARAEERARARKLAEKARDRATVELEVARSARAAAWEALEVAQEVAAKAANQRAILIAVEAVLGLRGVRAHVLGKSLSGLEAVTNAWLPRLGLPGLAIQLRPYSERKTGGVTDSISVEVTGAGNGYGYKAASSGERRRLDLALLLGLAEIAAASSGRENSTLFFDELFDAMDEDGRKAVGVALVELARDRCVVVVTHNPELVRELPADQRWCIANGKVTVEG